jgi:hypothetical protein
MEGCFCLAGVALLNGCAYAVTQLQQYFKILMALRSGLKIKGSENVAGHEEN